jgi:NAD(P)-dependent dehydrogenase (short-subunit alcohol dehydrogenase family)
VLCGRRAGALEQARRELDPSSEHALCVPDDIGRESELYQKVSELIPLGRLGNLEELADLILMLASPAANYMTGTSLVID